MSDFRFSMNIISAFLAVSVSNVSDACDRLAIDGAVRGIFPLFPCAKIAGHATTLKLARPSERMSDSPVTGTLQAIALGGPGAVLAVDGRGNPEVNCFGGIAGATAKHIGLAGCVADGPMRDVDEYKAYELPVYGRGIVQQAIRGRSALEGFNIPVMIGGVAVIPGDLIMADENGAIVVPRARVEEVVHIASIIRATEDRIIGAIRAGVDPIQAHTQVGYDDLLKPRMEVA